MSTPPPGIRPPFSRPGTLRAISLASVLLASLILRPAEASDTSSPGGKDTTAAPVSANAATLLPAPAGYPVFRGKGLTATLVTDVRTVRPGSTFHLGLWIRHDPGYHTYWSNPGLAGVPTKLAPELPAGFTTGAIIYPVPDKVRMAAINVHGYERDVLVALPVNVPADWTGTRLTLPVEATWMCCQRTCNPGHHRFTLTLEAGGTASASDPDPDPVWQPRFRELQASQPGPLNGWELQVRPNGQKHLLLTARPPAGQPLPEEPQFFSDDNLICSHPRQDWKKTGDGAYEVSLELSDFLPKDTTRLRGLLSGKPTLLPGREAPYAVIEVPIGTPVPEKP